MKKQEMEAKIHSAIDELFKRDKILLNIDVNERTITHRLAIYIEAEFSGWDVDCEYNRFFDKSKQIVVTKKLLSISGDGITSVANENAKTVFPDIIIHRRNSSDNLVAIEVKKTTNPISDDEDLQKLQAYKEQIGYVYAVFIRFVTGATEIGIQRLEVI